MELPDLDIASHSFTSTQSGMLEGSAANTFLDEAHKYISDLRTFYTKQSNEFFKVLEKQIKQETMSIMVFADLKAQAEALEKEITNKKLTLDRLDKCRVTCEKITFLKNT